jgi:NTP pyrophosphatase (non-canonical NTP hydrolase)
VTISELCKQSHQLAVEKGFWERNENNSLKKRNIPELLMLIVTELAEACEALRKNKRQTYELTTKTCHNLFTGKLLKKELLNESIWQKDSFEDEIADVFIRLGDMCEALGVDIEWQIKKKMEYNKNRPYKHGKQF